MDLPRTVRMLNEKDRAALGLAADKVFDTAIANLRQSLKPLEAEGVRCCAGRRPVRWPGVAPGAASRTCRASPA